MNRRGFLTRLAKAVVIATAAPVIIREVIAAQMPTIAYRSSIGIYEQLKMCERVVQPGHLNLDELFQTLYAMNRHREKNP